MVMLFALYKKLGQAEVPISWSNSPTPSWQLWDWSRNEQHCFVAKVAKKPEKGGEAAGKRRWEAVIPVVK